MRYSDTSAALALFAFVGLAPLAAPLNAQQAGDGGRLSTVACTDQPARIDGIGQRIRLTGECRTVVVSGSGHRVVVERAGVLNVSGMNNDVRWERSLEGDAPRIINSGIKNVVTRATSVAAAAPAGAAARAEKAPSEPAPAPAPRASAPAPRAPAPAPTTGTEPGVRTGERLVVKQSGQNLHLDCASRPVTVSGSTNTITLTGTCGQVSVSGTGNRITVERAPRIVTTGHNNEIVWEHGDGDGRPAVRDSGRNNTVRRAGL